MSDIVLPLCEMETADHRLTQGIQGEMEMCCTPLSLEGDLCEDLRTCCCGSFLFLAHWTYRAHCWSTKMSRHEMLGMPLLNNNNNNYPTNVVPSQKIRFSALCVIPGSSHCVPYLKHSHCVTFE